MEEKCDSIFVL
jgi:hypothetical protein